MKYSLIIVAYKAEDYLRKCLKSIKDSDIQDAEIVVVDNSPEQIFGDSKPPAACRLPFRAIWKGENLGFAEGCNLGARNSSGEILVFVNPDTEVYTDWAERLSERLVDGVVAVGPIASGFISGFQKASSYGITTLGRVAYDEAKDKFAGETLVGVKVLIGFFLMMRRKEFDEVGGMDKGCFLGCDDLDLSLRLRDMYGENCLAVAKDVCIMHDGHKSFESRPSKEVEKLIQESENHLREKLYAKHGGKPPSASELWGPAYFNTERIRPMTLSVCMIVRNEYKNLSKLIPQMQFADEIVLVNTDPSYDGLKSINEMQKCSDLQTFTEDGNGILRGKIKYHTFPWTKNFSEARNFALSKCTGDWVLWIDADDRIPEMTGKLIRAAMDKPGWKTWNRHCAFEFIVKNTNEGDTDQRAFQFHQMRLFPNLPGVKWTNRVHENALNSLMDMGIQFIPTDITIHHTGYSDPEILKAKHARNMELLEMEEDSPAKRFNIGNSHGTVNDWDKAATEYKTVLETKWAESLDAGFIDHVRFMVAVSLFHQDKIKDAAPYLDGNKKPDSVHLLGEWHLKMGDKDAAYIAFREYLRLTAKPSFDPWMSFRYLMRRHAYHHLIGILSDITEETIKGADTEYPGLLSTSEIKNA